ncbi:MAG: hypothetical protein WDM96_10300 [Lacunisphaera sp.]
MNLVPHALAGPMNLTATPLPHGESEFEAFAIATALVDQGPSAACRGRAGRL